jgi:drug/metabolite transporter (DMT)-like permease
MSTTLPPWSDSPGGPLPPTPPRGGSGGMPASRKPDDDVPQKALLPSQPSRQFSATPHFDIASSSSTAYIALPVPDSPMTSAPTSSPRGRLASFFHRNLGLFLIAGAQMFFSMMNLCAKLLSMGDPPIHPLEIIFVRMLITWLGAISYLQYNKVPDWFIGPKGVRLLLILRGVVGFFGLFGIYYSLQYLDLSDATVLTFLAPILTGYFGRIFLKEPFLRTELYAGFISLVGVVLIARPQSLFGDGAVGDATALQRLSAVGVALLGVLGAAAAYISIRAIGSRAHPLISVSMFALYATIVSAIGLAVLRHPLVFPHTLAGWGEWIIIGISGFAAQILLTTGLQRERAGRGVSMVYLQMVFAFGFERYLILLPGFSNYSRFIWGTIPDFWSISGSGLILGGAIWVAVAKSRVKHDVDDVERNGYTAVNGDDHTGKVNEFELGEISDEEEDNADVGVSSSSIPPSPSRDRESIDIKSDDELNVAGDGALSEINHWKGENH